jgi:2,3-bisphosphoglycerate-independent phosphoglycerate mutase
LLEEFDNMIREIGVGQIVDGVGRGLALDRDGDFGKIQKVYEALVNGKGGLVGI